MRLRDAWTVSRADGFHALGDALAGRRLDVLGLIVIFGSQIAVGTGLGLMVSRPVIASRILAGLLLIGAVILLWLCILVLAVEVDAAERKLVNAHNVLIDIASQKCRCDPNAVIIEAPKEPELVGKPAPMGYCDYCQARTILKEQCPEVFEPRIRTYSIAEVFAEECRSFRRLGTREEFEAHQAELEKEYPLEEELSQDEPKPGDPEYEMLKAKLLRLQAELGESDTPHQTKPQ